MKKTIVFFIAFAFVMSVAAPVMAAGMEKPIKKFADGTIEVVKSPLQLVKHPKSSMDEADHKPIGLLKGIMHAPFHMLKQAGGGVVDMVTFPIE
ncbi:MAG: hypothetical protein KC618_07715 [Candidatus Omnitrophica bacterium]|nr:hypothetical protein [Candidatus Omnitrophota bacterium]